MTNIHAVALELDVFATSSLCGALLELVKDMLAVSKKYKQTGVWHLLKWRISKRAFNALHENCRVGK